MEKLFIATTDSTDLPHLHSSFPSAILSCRKPMVHNVLCVHLLLQLSPLFLASQSSFSLPWSIPIRQEASNPILSYLPVLQSPLDPTPYSGCHPSSLYPSQANVCNKLSMPVSSPLSPPIQSRAYFLWFIPYGYRNLFLLRPLSALKLPNLGVYLPTSNLLELRETFHTVVYSQPLQIHVYQFQ